MSLVHILLLASPSDSVELLIDTLRQADLSFEWHQAKTEAEFLAALDAHPDAIIADFALPELDPIRALQLMRAHQRDIPVVVVGQTARAEDIVRCIKAGATDFVPREDLIRLAASVRAALAAERAGTGVGGDSQQCAVPAHDTEAQKHMLRTLLETTPDIVIFKDCAHRFIACSAAIARHFGLTMDEMVGKTDYDLFTPEEAEHFCAEEDEVLRAGHPIVAEHLLNTLQGQRWYEAIKTPLRDARGEIIGLLSTERDITERKLAEGQLRESERHLKKLQTALMELVTSPTLNNGDALDAFREVTESAATHLEVARVSIWFLDDARTKLQCVDAYDLYENEHTTGEELASGDYSAYFRALDTDRVIAAHDVQAHPILSVFNAGYHLPYGITSVLDAPIRLQGKTIGVICYEHVGPVRTWTTEEQAFASSVADMIALVLERTERRRAEAERDTQRRMLRAVLDTLPDFILFKDRDSVFRVVNRAFCDFFQKPEEEIIGATDHDLFPPEEAARFRAEELHVMETGATIVQEHYVCGATSSRWNEAIKTPLRDEKGQIVGVLSAEHDITARKAAEEALARRVQELQALYQIALELNSQPDLKKLLRSILVKVADLLTMQAGGIWLLNDEGTLLTMEAALNEGYPLIDTTLRLGEGLSGRVVATGEPIVVENYKEWEGRLPLRRPAQVGRILGVPLKSGGRLFGVITLADLQRSGPFAPEEIHLVTLFAEQAAIAVEKARLQASLKESEARYRSLFEKSLDGIALVDPEDGHLIDANPAFQSMLGYPLEELRALKLDDLLGINHYDAARCLWPAGERSTVMTLSRKDGRTFLAECSTWWIELGHRRLGVYVIRDVTEKMQLEERLREAQKMEAIGTLAGGIAHDFNNILGAILGYATFLKEGLPPDSPLRADAETIERSTRRGAELTHQLLAFARGTQEELRPLDVNLIVNEVVRLLSRTVNRSVEIQTVLAKPLASIQGDAGQIHQLLFNLCLNAVEAMPGGGLLRITTEQVYLDAQRAYQEIGQEPGHYVLLTVSDTGSGIPPEVMEHLFDPFFTTKRDHPDQKHSGLGLAVVFGIVKGHHGAIRVESKIGQGTTFRVWLPAIAEGPAVEEGHVTSRKSGGGETILVVEDEPALRDMLGRVLSNAGYRVLLAANGAEALEIYQSSGPISLVILDMIMPVMNGAQTYQSLKEFDPNLQVLVISGYAEQDEAQRVLANGVRGIISKPFVLGDLLDAVRKALGE